MGPLPSGTYIIFLEKYLDFFQSYDKKNFQCQSYLTVFGSIWLTKIVFKAFLLRYRSVETDVFSIFFKSGTI